MNYVCAWCRNPLSIDDMKPDDIVSHCFCPGCREKLDPGRDPVSFQDYLNGMTVPVLLLDADVGIVTANRAACEDLGIDPGSVEGRLGGDAIECINARLPGGCGKTVHCRTCAIRNTVTDTYRTSESHYGVPAHADCGTPEGVRKTRFLISTEKLGNLVVLRIEDIRRKGPDPPPG